MRRTTYLLKGIAPARDNDAHKHRSHKAPTFNQKEERERKIQVQRHVAEGAAAQAAQRGGQVPGERDGELLVAPQDLGRRPPQHR